jgi:3',5'-cyclic AMP phosphodiesterase CpdA
MAWIHGLGRREFLSASLGGMLAGATRSLRAQQGGRVRWALLSDTHIPTDAANEYRGFRPYENLMKLAPVVAESGVAGAVINGDLARLEGLPSDYVNFKRLLQPMAKKMPIAMALGNHDHRENFAAAFAEHPGEEQSIRNKHILVAPAGPAKLILLDSLLYPNLTPGLLGKDQRVWLEQYLPAAGPGPVLVFVHHTPGDRDSDLLDTDRLLSILTAAKNVKALIYGHSHQYAYEQVKGMHLINLPAVGYNFDNSQPVGWVHAEIGADGADFRLHAMAGNRSGDGGIKSLAWRG